MWVPEYMWDEIDCVPCPRCGERGQPDGWNTDARRVFLEQDVCYFIGYRYYCKRCTDANAMKNNEDRTTVTFNAWDPDVLGRMNDFVSKEFPFVLTRKGATSRSLVDRLADDLLEGKGFAVTSKSLLNSYTATYLKLIVRTYL
ncbi:unnamed protein product [Ectocarpus sp. CCAP 1310/34]|nr:unnamed protein product [Ectocarpus sp. CCAP 1310/34]